MGWFHEDRRWHDYGRPIIVVRPPPPNPFSVIAGVVGGLIGSAARRQDDGVPGGDDPEFTSAMTNIAKVPEQGTVVLHPGEFRALADRGMIQYNGPDAYCLNRKVQSAD